MFDPYGGEAIRTDAPDEEEDNKDIVAVGTENKEELIPSIPLAALDNIKVESSETADSIAVQPTEDMTTVKRPREDEGFQKTITAGVVKIWTCL